MTKLLAVVPFFVVSPLAVVPLAVIGSHPADRLMPFQRIVLLIVVLVRGATGSTVAVTQHAWIDCIKPEQAPPGV